MHSFGEGVRAQVFEVIVRQAIAGAPWREICAGPMAVNNIKPEDVEMEVYRRTHQGKEDLSDDQRQLLEDYFQDWEDTIFSGKTSSREKVEESVYAFYDAQQWPRPTVILCKSPIQMYFYMSALKLDSQEASNLVGMLSLRQDPGFEQCLLDDFKRLPAQVHDGVGKPLTAEFIRFHNLDLRPAVDESMKNALGDSLHSYFSWGFQLEVNSFLQRFGQAMMLAPTSIARHAFPDQSIDERSLFMFDDRPPALRELVASITGVWELPKDLAYDFVSKNVYSELWDTMNAKYSRTSRALVDLCRVVPWFSIFENVCFAGMFPESLVFDDQLRLSNRSGPAIVFKDSYSVFFIDGVLANRNFVLYPEKLTISDIEEERNAAMRRAMIDMYGASRYITDSGVELFQKDECGELYRKEQLDDEALVMVRVINSTPEPDGSYRSYWLRVPPHVDTAREAVAWTFNMNSIEYRPREET